MPKPKPPRQRRRKLPWRKIDDTAVAAHMLNGGTLESLIANFGGDRGSWYAYLRRKGLPVPWVIRRNEGPPLDIPLPPQPPRDISPAAKRLAEFDPIVRRALAGLPPPPAPLFRGNSRVPEGKKKGE